MVVYLWTTDRFKPSKAEPPHVDFPPFLADFAPSASVAIPAILFSTARFENQRWVRMRIAGKRGVSALAGLFVDASGAISLIFGIAFLVAYWFKIGWKPVVGLVVISQAIGILYSIVSTPIFRGDNLFVMLIGTIAVWPLMVWLAAQVTWFGWA